MYKLKILIVDDEIGIRQGISRTLSSFVFSIQEIEEPISFLIDTAENGEEARQKISELKPDLIMLDYKLPDTTGLDLLHEFQLKEEECLVIMITAFATLETAVSAIKSGAFDFLAKPFTPQELKNTITKAAKSLITARHLKKLSDERNQVRYKLISILGHELRAPLGAVEGYLYMLKDKIMGNDLSKYDEMISRCLLRTDHMRKLISDILEMTKIESGNRERFIQEVNLAEVAQTSINNMLADAQKNNIQIEFKCDINPVLSADRSEIEIVFNNLISNAIKYNKPNGKVGVVISESDGYYQIDVSDTGIGLTEEECAKLFNEFVRIKNDKTKNIFGSGVGLSTLKKIVQLYQGTVSVKSKPDEGSIFTCRLKK